MDNLTHTLTGLMLSRAGLNKLTAHASPILMLAANIPDIDVLSLIGGPANYLHYHRWMTHSIVMIPVMAMLPILIVRLFAKVPISYGWAYLISIVGVASHLLLDFTNIYGIRLLLPFSETWFRLDTTSVVDMWIWIALLLGVFGPALSGLVSSEIGAKRSTGRGAAICAILFVLLYDGTRVFLHQRALEVQEARLFDGMVPRRIIAMPSPINPLRWTGLVETDNAFVVQAFSLAFDFDPTVGRVYYKPEHSPLMDSAAHAQPVKDLLAFSPAVLWRIASAEESANMQKVEALDLRFGTPPNARFVAVALLNARGQVQRSWFEF